MILSSSSRARLWGQKSGDVITYDLLHHMADEIQVVIIGRVNFTIPAPSRTIWEVSELYTEGGEKWDDLVKRFVHEYDYIPDYPYGNRRSGISVMISELNCVYSENWIYSILAHTVAYYHHRQKEPNLLRIVVLILALSNFLILFDLLFYESIFEHLALVVFVKLRIIRYFVRTLMRLWELDKWRMTYIFKEGPEQ